MPPTGYEPALTAPEADPFAALSSENAPHGGRLGSVWGEASSRRRCRGLAAHAQSCGRPWLRRHGGLRAQLPNRPVTRSRRRLRRRWPGVSAGLSLGEARPARAGPHSAASTPDQDRSWGTHAGTALSRLPRLRLSSSRPSGGHSQGPGACEENGAEWLPGSGRR